MRRDLARKHLDKRLSQWQPTSELASPPRGWIRAIREAIGMTAAQLANRCWRRLKIDHLEGFVPIEF